MRSEARNAEGANAGSHTSLGALDTGACFPDELVLTRRSRLLAFVGRGYTHRAATDSQALDSRGDCVVAHR